MATSLLQCQGPWSGESKSGFIKPTVSASPRRHCTGRLFISYEQGGSPLAAMAWLTCLLCIKSTLPFSPNAHVSGAHCSCGDNRCYTVVVRQPMVGNESRDHSACTISLEKTGLNIMGQLHAILLVLKWRLVQTAAWPLHLPHLHGHATSCPVLAWLKWGTQRDD